VKLTLGTDVSLIGKEKLGQVAYETAQRIAPELASGDWEDLTEEDRQLFIGIAVSVRGFHPDA
jgi:hypothetical protein